MSIVYPGQLAEEVVRGRWQNVPASSAVRSIGSQVEDPLGVIRRSDTVYVLGKPDEIDLVARVFHVPEGEASEFIEAVGVLATSNAAVASVGDAVVVKDTIEGLLAVSELFDALKAARGQWVVEVRFVEITRAGARKLGIDWELVGSVAVSGSLATVSPAAAGTAIANADLIGLLTAEETGRDVRLLTQGRLHVVEGTDALLQVGDTTPIPQRTVSDQGTVTTTGFTEIDTGLIVPVSVRTEPSGLLRVSLQPEISSVTGDVDGFPIRSRRRIETAAVVEPGGVVVVGGFSERLDRQQRDGLPYLSQLHAGGTHDDESRVSRLFVVVRVVDPALPLVDMKAMKSWTFDDHYDALGRAMQSIRDDWVNPMTTATP